MIDVKYILGMVEKVKHFCILKSNLKNSWLEKYINKFLLIIPQHSTVKPV